MKNVVIHVNTTFVLIDLLQFHPVAGTPSRIGLKYLICCNNTRLQSGNPVISLLSGLNVFLNDYLNSNITLRKMIKYLRLSAMQISPQLAHLSLLRPKFRHFINIFLLFLLDHILQINKKIFSLIDVLNHSL